MRMAVAVAEKPQFNRSGLRFRADGARLRINQPMSPQSSQDGLDGRSGLRIDRRSVRRERHTWASASNDLLTLDQDFRAADPSDFPNAQPENRNRFNSFDVNSHAVDRRDEPPASSGVGGDALLFSHPVAGRRIGHNIRLSNGRHRRRSRAQLLDVPETSTSKVCKLSLTKNSFCACRELRKGSANRGVPPFCCSLRVENDELSRPGCQQIADLRDLDRDRPRAE